MVPTVLAAVSGRCCAAPVGEHAGWRRADGLSYGPRTQLGVALGARVSSESAGSVAVD